jgi:FAD dependent oxidoreductase
MEPQYMIMGHAAGLASAAAAASKVAVHKVDLARLQGRLREQDQILSLDGR